jgi:Mn-dependent DtxR family transcriptional regulator
MNIYQQIVNQKIKTITPEELVSYSKDYGIYLTKEEAQKIIQLVRNNKINVFDPKERVKWVKELAKITSPQTAKQANALFLQFTKKK